MATAIYLRVSSKLQDQRSQEADLQKWRTISVDECVWFRETFTGTTLDRPKLNKLLEGVRDGSFNRIVVWRLDRLGRTARGLLELCEELQERQVTLVSLREGIDLSTPAGRLLIGILASMAQFETEVRGERQRAGIAAAQAQGKKWGGSRKGPRKLTNEMMLKIDKYRKLGLKAPGVAKVVEISTRAVQYAFRDLDRGDFHAKSTRQLAKD